MCRWLAYAGPSIFLERLIFKPQNSLICQSLHACEGATVTNGDGFGIGWYDRKAEPGLVRDVHPAWNDENLLSLAAQIESGHFFAHVRAATGTPIARSNCHPFRHGRWLFMHNGVIGGYRRLRRDIALRVDPRLFSEVTGTTDSELFFYLLLSRGLESDPELAFRRTVGEIMELMQAEGVEEPFRMTAALTDGHTIYALRHAIGAEGPSLYYACGPEPLDERGETTGATGNSIVILSEPLDRDERQWISVPDSHFLVAGDGAIAISAFAPET